MVKQAEQRKPRTRVVCVRLTETGFEYVAVRAEKADVEVSHMIRRMLSYAAAHMPEGYKAPAETR